MSLTIFVCDPWESYLQQLAIDSDREWLEHERQEDLDHEEMLRAEFFEALEADEITEDDWPWWADKPWDVEYPQVFAT